MAEPTFTDVSLPGTDAALSRREIRRLPVADGDHTIVLYLDAHGTVLESAPFPAKIRKHVFWYSHVPFNGCYNYGRNDDQGHKDLYEWYQHASSSRTGGKLHQHVVNLYCNKYGADQSFEECLNSLAELLSFLGDEFHLILELDERNQSINEMSHTCVRLRDLIKYREWLWNTDDGGEQIRLFVNLFQRFLVDLETQLSAATSAIADGAAREKLQSLVSLCKRQYYVLRSFYDKDEKRFVHKSCSKFRRVLLDKELTFADPIIQEYLGIFVVYDSNPQSRVPYLASPNRRRSVDLTELVKKYNRFLETKKIRLSAIIQCFLGLGYKQIYIYDTSCNLNSKASYDAVFQQPIETGYYDPVLGPLARSISGNSASGRSDIPRRGQEQARNPTRTFLSRIMPGSRITNHKWMKAINRTIRRQRRRDASSNYSSPGVSRTEKKMPKSSLFGTARKWFRPRK
jgi:hypothetical protein